MQIQVTTRFPLIFNHKSNTIQINSKQPLLYGVDHFCNINEAEYWPRTYINTLAGKVNTILIKVEHQNIVLLFTVYKSQCLPVSILSDPSSPPFLVEEGLPVIAHLKSDKIQIWLPWLHIFDFSLHHTFSIWLKIEFISNMFWKTLVCADKSLNLFNKKKENSSLEDIWLFLWLLEFVAPPKT